MVKQELKEFSGTSGGTRATKAVKSKEADVKTKRTDQKSKKSAWDTARATYTTKRSDYDTKKADYDNKGKLTKAKKSALKL